MFYFNALNLNQIRGGNQVKQGDFGSTFTYKLADEENQELDIFDQKTAYVNLVLNNNIVFTTTVIVDGSTVTFNIDKAIPTGLYFLEIKIDSYIFPSDRQTIILVTAGSVAYDLKDLVPNYDTKMTISSILSDLSQKGIDISDLKTKMNAIYSNALADRMEVSQARGTYNTLAERLNETDNKQLKTTAQLAQTNDNVKANSTYYSMQKQPVVTFIDDDGHVDVYNRLYPIFSAKGIKGCSAIIAGSVDVDASTLTSSQLDDLHHYGWEFLGHGHSYTANLMEFPMDSDLEYQLGEGCKGWLENRGYSVNGFVYPQGVSNERIRRFTKKYYDFAFQGNTFNEGDFVDTTRIQRIAFGSRTSSNPTVNGNSEKNTLAYYKACVDYASANNIWLIFMSHVGQQDVSQDVILSDLVTYIQSSNVKILTASEGYKIHGNKIFVGDKDSDYLAINENGLYSNNIYPSCELKQDTKYLTDGINSYDSGMSVMLVSYAFGSANGFPGNTSGVLITYRFSKNYTVYNKQEFLQNSSNKKYVRYALTGTTWSAFEEIMTSASIKNELQTAIDTANTNLAEKLEDFELTNNSRLLSVERGLADVAKPIVCFTFDDGLAEDSLTYSVFKAYGYPAGFGLITDQLYNSNKNPVLNYKNYEKDGFEVLSHSSSHIYFNTDNTDPVNYHELTVSAEKLQTLGFSANGLIVPYSTITVNNLAYAKTIYDYILIGGTGLNGKNGFKKKTITRVSAFGSGVAGCKTLIDQAISDRQLLVFYDHGMGRAGSLTEAEWREVLTYVQAKVSNNLIEVHNVKNAISKFYGIEIPNLAKPLNDYNQLPLLNKSSWILENNTAGVTKAIDTSYSNETLRVTVPLNAAVGTSVTLSNTVTLPASVEALGDRTKFVARIKMGNLQFTYFDKFIEVSYLGASGAVLLTESKQIYPGNTFGDNYFVDLFPKYPLLPKDITKIKVSIKFNVLTTPTANHFIYISDAFLQFPNYREKTNVVELTSTNLTDNSATPTVTGKEYFFVNNPLATSITNFVTADLIQEITLLFGNANTTITGAGSVRLKDRLDWTPAVGSVLTLYRNSSFSSAWWEKSRTVR